MSTTLDALLKKFDGNPVVRLSDICEQYVGVKPYQARIRANLNKLPFPAFRLDPSSHKTPWMVALSDLAAYVDAQAEAARASWTHSQT